MANKYEYLDIDITGGFIQAVSDYAKGFGRVVVDLGASGVEHIKRRTRYGNVDRYGVGFRAYSPNYKKVGKSVDLTDTGEMLDSLAVVTSQGSVVDTSGRGSTLRSTTTGRFEKIDDVRIGIGFSNPLMAQRASYHTTPRGKMPKRDFGGLEEIWVQEELENSIRRHRFPTRTSKTKTINIGV